MNTQELGRSLKKGKPAAVYLVAGEEDALVDRALATIHERVLSEIASADFSFTRLDGKSATAQEVEGAARTASLFGGRRLVVLRDAQALRAEEQKRLAAYIEQPVATTTLVLVVRGADARTRDPKRAKAAKAAKLFEKAVRKGAGVSVECPHPKQRDLPRLAKQMLKDGDLSADADGVYALVEAVGEDLGGLVRAVEKLSLFLGAGGTVTARAVADVVADTRSQSIFALTDAVGEGTPARALRILARMQRDGESALAILGHLARHFRNLALVFALTRRGESLERIREALGLHPFVVKKCQMQLKRFAPGALSRCLARIADADRRVKRHRLPEELLLERLVFSLSGGG